MTLSDKQLKFYDDAIAELEARREHCELWIAATSLILSIIGCGLLTAASSPGQGDIAALLAIPTLVLPLALLGECFHLWEISRDILIYKTDKRNDLPPDRADSECVRSVSAALAEGRDLNSWAEAA